VLVLSVVGRCCLLVQAVIWALLYVLTPYINGYVIFINPHARLGFSLVLL